MPMSVLVLPFPTEHTVALSLSRSVICRLLAWFLHLVLSVKDKEEHNRRLEMVLRKLSESKVTLNWEKCEFAQPEVKFLGQIIDQNGVHPDP